MNNKIILIILCSTIAFISFNKKNVYGSGESVSVEEILKGDVKCPDHDRPEIVSEVQKLVQAGKNKDDILDAIASKFGAAVLVNPRDKGASLIFAYVIPVICLVLSLIFISAFIGKWIKKNKKEAIDAAPSTVQAAGNQDKYEKQFEDEFKSFK